MNLIEKIREAWGWVGLDPEEVVGENDLGNLMIRDTRGKYWHLCPEELDCEVVADDRESLDRLSADPEFRELWHMEGLVEQAKEKLGPLEEGWKYYLVRPGVLGGEYAVSNVQTAPLAKILGISGSLARQIVDLPDGARIELEILE